MDQPQAHPAPPHEQSHAQSHAPPQVTSGRTSDSDAALARDVAQVWPSREHAVPPPLNIHIGRYQVKHSIGTGGMGTVYEAVHDELRSTVALKLMKFRAASPEAMERFIREARVLASCHHANVAHVYDAGIHRQGEQEIPYYVMEFVRGARIITRWAEEKQLSIDQRLELFAKVCDALHAVHERGVVHRDIKPENVLVDSAGEPKVIDFGVARVLNSDLPLPAYQTRGENLVGTLQYMSPEQTGGPEAGDIDRRADVYALGLLLYELLCGRPPYDLHNLTLDGAIQTIRQRPPAPPRSVNPALDEDLETILLKALHKDRDRRYPTAAALATSIRSRLAGEPIPDRRDSTTYVLRKRARALVVAHRVSMWICVTVAALLLALMIGQALEWTPLYLWFERTMTSRIQPAGYQPMTKVRMIALRDGGDLKALGQRLGLPDVDPAHKVTLRRLHGALMKRLARSGARVVAFDILFPKPSDESACPYEQDLLDGVAALQENNIEVVFTAGQFWDVGQDDLAASLCPALARVTKWGFITVNASEDAPWSLDLAIQPKDRQALPSLALTACAAYWRPDRFAWVASDVDLKTLARYVNVNYARPDSPRPRAWGAPAESYVDRIRLSATSVAREADPEVGRSVGDWIGSYVLHIPADERIQEALIDYETIFRADDAKLREWFEGRVVVVGDARAASNDGPFPTPDGRSYPGFVVHAIGIDSILASRTILLPFRVDLAGFNVESIALYAACGTFAGAVLAVLPMTRWRRRMLTALLLLVIAGTSIVLYQQGRMLHDPLPAMVGALLAAEGAALFGAVGRQRLPSVG